MQHGHGCSHAMSSAIITRPTFCSFGRTAEEGGAEEDPVAALLKQAERAHQMLIWHSQVRGLGTVDM